MPEQLAATCRAALFHGPEQGLEIREVEVPDLEPGEALVRIECCTICGSDLHTLSGRRIEPTPSILGHEAIGVISQLGSQPATDQKGQILGIGDRITWSVAVSCFECDRCLQGLPQKCRHLFKYGHAKATGRYRLSGGLAEYIVLQPGSTIVRLPPELPAEVASPANCATATVAACFRSLPDPAGKTILISGAGMLGLTAAAFAAAAKAARIVVIDPIQERLDLAEQFGATDTVLRKPEVADISKLFADRGLPLRFSQCLEFAGSTQSVETVIELADVGAHVVLAGTVAPTSPVALDPQHIVRNCLNLHGVHNYAPQDLVRAVDFLQHNRQNYPFKDLVERSYPLEEIVTATCEAIEKRPIRIAIHP